MSTTVSSWSAGTRFRHTRENSRCVDTSLHLDCRETYKTNLLSAAHATWNCEQPKDIRALIKTRSNVDERDNRGNTCLHHLLGAANPNQPWVVLSLILLLRAGADPHQPNHYGFTAFDIACDAPAALGSFRRDLLLQGLLEREMDIQDPRLLTPTRLTSTYTEMSHAVLFGNASSHCEYQLRISVLERLTETLDQRNLVTERKLVEEAFKRVLHSYALAAFTDSETIFNDTLSYLELMCDGKKKIVRLCKIRLQKEFCLARGPNLNLLGMTQQAYTSALLEFDWFRPVDVEDLFAVWADIMIDQLEDLSPVEQERENVAACIDLLQNAIPSYRALSMRDGREPSVPAVTRPDSANGLITAGVVESAVDNGFEGRQEWPLVDEEGVEERERKESIAKTPVEFYAPTPWSN